MDAITYGVAIRFAGGDQAEQCPRGLRGGDFALAGQRRVVVAQARLAPAAVVLLHALEPGDRALDHRLHHIIAGDFETLQDLPGAVEIVDAPAADPAAALVLRQADELDAAFDLRMADADAEETESFEDAGGNVGAARIEDRAMVGGGGHQRG